MGEAKALLQLWKLHLSATLLMESWIVMARCLCCWFCGWSQSGCADPIIEITSLSESHHDNTVLSLALRNAFVSLYAPNGTDWTDTLVLHYYIKSKKTKFLLKLGVFRQNITPKTCSQLEKLLILRIGILWFTDQNSIEKNCGIFCSKNQNFWSRSFWEISEKFKNKSFTKLTN